MERSCHPGAASTTSTAGPDVGSPGKRTLTEGLPPIQAKAADPGGSSPADPGGPESQRTAVRQGYLLLNPAGGGGNVYNHAVALALAVAPHWSAPVAPLLGHVQTKLSGLDRNPLTKVKKTLFG
jgi:hypothetical protein